MISTAFAKTAMDIYRHTPMPIIPKNEISRAKFDKLAQCVCAHCGIKFSREAFKVARAERIGQANMFCCVTHQSQYYADKRKETAK